MSYEKTLWEDGKTPLDATRLNKLEEGVHSVHEAQESTHKSHVLLQNIVRVWKPVFNPDNGHVIMTPVIKDFNV